MRLVWLEILQNKKDVKQPQESEKMGLLEKK